jgi:SAM-dependent methyltransferase
MADEAAPRPDGADDTTSEWYTKRMTGLGAKLGFIRWAHSIVYRRHIRGLVTGRVLDVGSGIGSNLRFLGSDSVGVDHNAHSVEETKARGLTAYTPDEMHGRAGDFKETFDSILCAHVMEHMDRESGVALLEEYLPYLKTTSRIVLIMPQEAGYRTDPTHVRLVDFDAARDLVEAVGFTVRRSFSWPLPRKYGPKLSSNEFVVMAERRK